MEDDPAHAHDPRQENDFTDSHKGSMRDMLLQIFHLRLKTLARHNINVSDKNILAGSYIIGYDTIISESNIITSSSIADSIPLNGASTRRNGTPTEAQPTDGGEPAHIPEQEE